MVKTCKVCCQKQHLNMVIFWSIRINNYASLIMNITLMLLMVKVILANVEQMFVFQIFMGVNVLIVK
ncbi:hypothetical protein PFTANZ_05791 [Plasmodium falciparum Tanzania (2000708)]|uniref:Uncharacterized protein n=1 Tax=Plasmodium falciparum Tanzania (2000708) TaxID=1036725 RepID=A0A024VZ10_PLAFA|nr:hypothetical protein PFTANZ_05791 [Plasmodium falciparum Tanzania (2000708)]